MIHEKIILAVICSMVALWPFYLAFNAVRTGALTIRPKGIKVPQERSAELTVLRNKNPIPFFVFILVYIILGFGSILIGWMPVVL